MCDYLEKKAIINIANVLMNLFIVIRQVHILRRMIFLEIKLLTRTPIVYIFTDIYLL